MSMAHGSGIVSKPSKHSVEETVERLKGTLQAKGVTLFALVDHSGEAEKVGMKMRPTKLLIFGSPKAGTPLMLAAPSVAIDLPLKILVSEDAQGKVWVSYNSAEYLRERHGLPEELMGSLESWSSWRGRRGSRGRGRGSWVLLEVNSFRILRRRDKRVATWRISRRCQRPDRKNRIP